MRRLPAKAMAGDEGKCVPVAHMQAFPASCSRTYACFRPENRVAAGKQGEVREPEANNWRETGGCACEMPGNRGRCARTSSGFVSPGRGCGRNLGDVRESTARPWGRCVRLAHMGPFRAKGMDGTRGMCVRLAHMGPFRAKRMAGIGSMCASASPSDRSRTRISHEPRTYRNPYYVNEKKSIIWTLRLCIDLLGRGTNHIDCRTRAERVEVQRARTEGTDGYEQDTRN
jgi:hypothetical protein